MSDLIVKGAVEIKDGLYNIKDGKLFKYKENGGTVRTYPIISAEQEPKRGKWIDHTDEGFVECPFCHSATTCEDNIDELKFCFSCGARMESDADGSD